MLLFLWLLKSGPVWLSSYLVLTGLVRLLTVLAAAKTTCATARSVFTATRTFFVAVKTVFAAARTVCENSSRSRRLASRPP